MFGQRTRLYVYGIRSLHRRFFFLAFQKLKYVLRHFHFKFCVCVFFVFCKKLWQQLIKRFRVHKLTSFSFRQNRQLIRDYSVFGHVYTLIRNISCISLLFLHFFNSLATNSLHFLMEVLMCTAFQLQLAPANTFYAILFVCKSL